MSGFEVNYSNIDRMVHTLAMSQLQVQRSLARIEDKGFDRDHGSIRAQSPVFITSLPRAGTTLLLELLAGTSEFASHTYRDMPFLLCPIIWDRISRRFRKQAHVRERAHGDGMLVSYDSVEAFEEVLWRAFWPTHFEPTRIRPWAPDEEDDDGEFPGFLRQHMRKIVGLGRQRAGTKAARRYVSKNNANIARLGWLARNFPDATILIPYRNPFAHVASLWRQHANFLEAHAKDPFIRRYMESIGHLEFGEALRPIDFDDWLSRVSDLKPGGRDFWLEYWIAAFSAVLRDSGPSSVILCYDRLCASPEVGLATLEERLALKHGMLMGQASRLRAPTPHEILPRDLATNRGRRLQEVLEQLDTRALF